MAGVALAIVAAPAVASAFVEPDGSPLHPAAVEEPRRAAGVELGEVASRVDPSRTRIANVKELLRAEAESELASIEWGKLRRRYLVSATVVKLDSTKTGERTLSVACTVSAAVREADSGRIVFLVEGKARAEDAASEGERAERDALGAAARGAMKALPEGLRQAQ